ncbi:MAG: hypothetical protein IT379_30075 [Deltaproteobacteria bacterium]|nr:hypothetical protein [Deltaproteobacteria bacterium]
MRVPKTYRSIEDFEREELKPGHKIGFNLDDLYAEVSHMSEHEFLFDQHEEDER